MDEFFMKEALKEAKKAYDLDEVPVGAVLVMNGKIVACGHNRNKSLGNPLYHAEMMALDQASKKLGLRLPEAELYVTLEPCAMCAGAIVQARIRRVIIGTMDEKRGCAGSVFNLLQHEKFNHRCQVEHGVLEKECSEIVTRFFRELRDKKKMEKKK